MLWCHARNMQRDCDIKIYKVNIYHKQRFRSKSFSVNCFSDIFLYLSQNKVFWTEQDFCSGHNSKLMTVPPFWLPSIQFLKYCQSICGPVNSKQLSVRSGNTGSRSSGRMNSADESRAWRERTRSSVGEWQPDRGMTGQWERRRGRERWKAHRRAEWRFARHSLPPEVPPPSRTHYSTFIECEMQQGEGG